MVCYLDDVTIFSDTETQHVAHVQEVLRRLRANKLYAKAEKCHFHQQAIEFLGYKVNPAGLEMEDQKAADIVDWQTPRILKNVQSFLGFRNFYRRFIKNYSTIAAPLTAITKGTGFQWNEAEQTAFDSLKHAFTQAGLLANYEPDKQLILETDASDFAIGAVLSHELEDGKLAPICFYSRKMHDAELNYPIHDKEMMAVIAAFKQWRQYLEGASKIKVYTTRVWSTSRHPKSVIDDKRDGLNY
jgi:hypothetical protein